MVIANEIRRSEQDLSILNHWHNLEEAVQNIMPWTYVARLCWKENVMMKITANINSVRRSSHVSAEWPTQCKEVNDVRGCQSPILSAKTFGFKAWPD